MRVTPRVVALAILVWIGAYLLWDVKRQSHLVSPDPSRLLFLYMAVLIVGTAIALIVAFIFLPALGQRAGSFFFNPHEEIVQGPHDNAISRLARGDAEGAIAEYERVVAADPDDSLAWSEMARICSRELEDPARANAILERALERDWPPEQASFLGSRVADIALEQGDAERAQAVLQQIADTMPGTKFEANARRRIAQIGRSPQRGKRPAALPDEPE